MTLFQRFALMASIVLGFTMIAVGSWMSSRIAEGSLRSGAVTAALYMTNFLEPHIQSLAGGDDLSPAEMADLGGIANDRALRRHVASIKIWRPDGTIVFSSQKALIGRKFGIGAIQPALRGHITSAMADLDEDDSEFERGLSMPLYEVFAPLHKTGTSEVIAVGEFYENATELSREMTAATRNSWLVVAGSALCMLGALFAIVYRGSATIERQNALLGDRLREETRLRQSHSALEEKMRSALIESSRIDEQVQRRLGAELHDGPAQLLAFVLVRLDEVRDALVASRTPLMTFDAIRAAASDALKDIRLIAAGLLLQQIDEATNPLVALQTVIAEHELRTNSAVALHASNMPERLPTDLIRCIGRVTQEALTNAAKHAGAVDQSVSISIAHGAIVLSIRDGGPGIETGKPTPKADEKGLGLIGMKYRVESVGGRLDIRSGSALGTEVVALIPYPQVA